jgi:hypothetical protein|tara:strand:+ start:537 stop:707 length:171 start_codon:yes stop_codon:yes gene_type:complete
MKISLSMQNKKNKLKKWWLDYFDWNQDGKTNWWEYCIPMLIVIEVIAEILARIILN